MYSPCACVPQLCSVLPHNLLPYDFIQVTISPQNMAVPYYVIEIHILPFLPQPNVDPVILQLYPIYEDEEERAYVRGSASVHTV